MQPSFLIEKQFIQKNTVGIDESGRGSIAGPVVASCVFLDMQKNYDFYNKINDSKKLTAKKRQKILIDLEKYCLFGIGVVDILTIDRINILQATKQAMYLAYLDFVLKYQWHPNIVLVDGNVKPFACQNESQQIITVKQGDTKSLSIAAASIIAKELRNLILIQYNKSFFQYGFDSHFGYLTELHKQQLSLVGPCSIHRKSFYPINLYDNNNSAK